MDTAQNSFQDGLLKAVINKYSSKNKGIEALSKLLKVGIDPIYKRLRGETILNAQEVALLAKTYNISLDQILFENTALSLFEIQPQKSRIASVNTFLDNIHQNLMAISQINSAKIYYASADLPFLHLMGIPELICFKLYVWGTTVWNLDKFQETSFSFDLFSEQSINRALEISQIYNVLPSTELWGLNSFDNIINQIEYFVNCQGFQKPQDAILIVEKLEELIDQTSKMAELGQKYTDGEANLPAVEFNLYQNELLYSNTLIYLDCEAFQSVFASFGDPYFLSTSDGKICELTRDWFKNLILKSSSISKQAESNRKGFFHKLKKKVSNSKNKIEVLLDEWV